MLFRWPHKSKPLISRLPLRESSKPRTLTRCSPRASTRCPRLWRARTRRLRPSTCFWPRTALRLTMSRSLRDSPNRTRCLSTKLNRVRLSESGSASASLTRTAMSLRRENAHLSPSETSVLTWRKKRRRSSWLNWADDGYISSLNIIKRGRPVVTAARVYHVT